MFITVVTQGSYPELAESDHSFTLHSTKALYTEV